MKHLICVSKARQPTVCQFLPQNRSFRELQIMRSLPGAFSLKIHCIFSDLWRRNFTQSSVEASRFQQQLTLFCSCRAVSHADSLQKPSRRVARNLWSRAGYSHRSLPWAVANVSFWIFFLTSGRWKAWNTGVSKPWREGQRGAKMLYNLGFIFPRCNQDQKLHLHCKTPPRFLHQISVYSHSDLLCARAPNRSHTVLSIFCYVPARYSHKKIVVPGWGQLLDEEQPFEAECKQESGYADEQRKHVDDFKLKDGVDKNKWL